MRFLPAFTFFLSISTLVAAAPVPAVDKPKAVQRRDNEAAITIFSILGAAAVATIARIGYKSWLDREAIRTGRAVNDIQAEIARRAALYRVDISRYSSPVISPITSPALSPAGSRTISRPATNANTRSDTPVDPNSPRGNQIEVGPEWPPRRLAHKHKSLSSLDELDEDATRKSSAEPPVLDLNAEPRPNPSPIDAPALDLAQEVKDDIGTPIEIEMADLSKADLAQMQETVLQALKNETPNVPEAVAGMVDEVLR